LWFNCKKGKWLIDWFGTSFNEDMQKKTGLAHRIRVVQFILSLDPAEKGGGADYYGLRLAMQLDPLRFESLVCALWTYGTRTEQAWQQRLSRAGIGAHFLAPRTCGPIWQQRLVAIRAFRPYLERYQPEIVNCHTEPSDLLVMQVRPQLSQSPLFVRTVHSEQEWSTLPVVIRKLFWHLHPLIYNQEVGVSKRVVGQLSQRPLARFLSRRVPCMANGIDVADIVGQRQGPSLRKILGLQPTAFLIGSVGRLESHKGYDWLLEAFHEFLKTGVVAHLVLVGDGPLRAGLTRQVRALGLQKQVHLLGGRPDRLSIIDQLDVFVSSSLREGLSTVVMEAMVLETPVIATSVSGSVELVLPYKTGLLIPPRDVEACMQALLYFFRHPQERRRMANTARMHVGHFSFASTVADYAEFYENLLEPRLSR
jgi:glycosyltransferase involved in cell wall biosynthesis